MYNDNIQRKRILTICLIVMQAMPWTLVAVLMVSGTKVPYNTYNLDFNVACNDGL